MSDDQSYNDDERPRRGLNQGRRGSGAGRGPNDRGGEQRRDGFGGRARDDRPRSTGGGRSREREGRSGSFSDNRERGDRPRGGFGNRDNRDRDDRPRGGFGNRDRDERSRGGFGNRDRDERPRGGFGNRDRDDRPRGGFGNRDRDDRPRDGFGNRDRDDRPRGGFANRDNRDRGDRPRGGFANRDRDDRPRGGFTNRDNRDRGERPRGGFGSRDRDDRSRGGFANRDNRDRGDRPRGQGRPWEDDRRGFRADREPKEIPPGLAPRPDEPETPKDLDLRSLPRPVRAELRGLPSELADIVGAHLLAAGMLIDQDPALAYRHAEAARRRAARLPVIREACAETAYAAGEYQAALNEYRALRRMSGGAEYLPVMADCERALGRPEEALKLAREARSARLDVESEVEMRIIEAGAREDLGQQPEALRLLKTGAEEFVDAPAVAQARLRFAFGEMLMRAGRDEQGRRVLESAHRLDPEDLSGVGERLAELDGLSIDLDFEVEDAEAAAAAEAEEARRQAEKEQRRLEREAARAEAEAAEAEAAAAAEEEAAALASPVEETEVEADPLAVEPDGSEQPVDRG